MWLSLRQTWIILHVFISLLQLFCVFFQIFEKIFFKFFLKKINCQNIWLKKKIVSNISTIKNQANSKIWIFVKGSIFMLLFVCSHFVNRSWVPYPLLTFDRKNAVELECSTHSKKKEKKNTHTNLLPHWERCRESVK